MLGIDAYVENGHTEINKDEKTVQYSVIITSDFADSIKYLIKSTGFYKNRTQFLHGRNIFLVNRICNDRIFDYRHEG